MYSLKPLGLAAALTLLPTCGSPVEQPEPTSAQQEVPSACEHFRAAIGMEVAIEQLASDPAAQRLFPPAMAEATWENVHEDAMAALRRVDDQSACLREILDGK